MYDGYTTQDVVLGEFNCLIECLKVSAGTCRYIYFEANASQAMAELLKEENFDLIVEGVPM